MRPRPFSSPRFGGPSRSLWFVVAVLVAVLATPWLNVPRDQADSAGMLAHLHGHFVGLDLLYDDEYQRLGMSSLFAFVTREGVVSNHWPSAPAWWQAPGYLLGLWASRLLGVLGVGRSGPMGVVVVLAVRAWAALVLAAMAAAVVRAVRGAGGGALAAALVTWCFVVGTPLLHYALESPLRPHLWAAALVLGAVILWARPAVGSPRSRAIVLALCLGAATAMRPQLAPLGLLVLEDVARTGRPWGRHTVATLAWSGLAFLLWPTVHLRQQLWIYGDRLSDYGAEVSHHLGPFLLSPYHGVVPWCPVLVIGAGSMAWAAITRQRGAWLLLGLLAHQIWLDAGMHEIEAYRVLGTRTWAGGVSFGPRKLVEVLPLFLPSVLAFVQRHGARPLGRGVAILAVLATAPTLSLHVAAFLAPMETTGAVLDFAALRDVLLLPLQGEAWAGAMSQRALPILVPLVLAAVVVIPLGWLLIAYGRASARMSSSARLHLVAVAIAGLGVVAHLWTSVLQVRSDAALAEDPARMRRAAEHMHPRHEATVRRIPAHHAELASVLGPDAVP